MRACLETSPLNDRRMLNDENWFEGPYEDSQGSCTLKLCQNICFLNIYWYKQKTIALAWNVQKAKFVGVHLGWLLNGVVPPNYGKVFVFWIFTDINKKLSP